MIYDTVKRTKDEVWRREREAWKRYKQAVTESGASRSNSAPRLPLVVLALGAAWLAAFRERRRHFGA